MAAKPLSIARLLGAPALVLALSASHAQAQLIIDPMKPPTAPPWNALKPFEPTPLPLLSDPDNAAIAAFGSWIEKSLYGRKYMGTDRSTFIIDPEGRVRHVWRGVKVKGHVAEVLATLRTLVSVRA